MWIIKSLELSVHAIPAKIYFFNVLPRTLCFAWKKAAVTHMRLDEKLWDKGWYFAITAAIFGNVNSSTSSKCGMRNVIRFKEQPNKKTLLATAFQLYYMQAGCRKEKMLRVKDTQTMWNIFKLVVLLYSLWKYSKCFWWIENEISLHFFVKTKNGNLNI